MFGSEHPLNYLTTFRADYTQKELDLKAARQHKDRRGQEARRSADILDEAQKKADRANLISTQRRDFVIPGFDPAVAAVKRLERHANKPAGQPTSLNSKSLRYGSDDLATLISASKTSTHNRKHDIFLPVPEQHKRQGGIQTFADWPLIAAKRVVFGRYADSNDQDYSICISRGEDFERRQKLIRRPVVGGITVGVAGK
ncbi:hypothetical protein SpCBS45565_g07182 [Spizellomyces sp. 'palustris']|nr:hypothetical protein SpCBS45565_g07182 [Spizellomyces sp. 'palustris']